MNEPLFETDASQSHLVIPKWFLNLSAVGLSLMTITFIPWAIWQTSVTMKLSFQMETVANANVGRMKYDIETLQNQVNSMADELLRRTQDRFTRRDMQNWAGQLIQNNPDLRVPKVPD